MTEEEKYRRKAELLRRAIRFADGLDEADAEADSATASAGYGKTTRGADAAREPETT